MTTRPLNIFLITALFATTGTVALGAETAPPPTDKTQAKYTDAVAGVVNGKVITLTQLRKEMDPLMPSIYNELEAKYPGDDDSARKELNVRVVALEKELLNGMIDRILIIQDFNDRGYSIPKQAKDQLFDDNMMTRFKGDHEAFLLYLKSNDLTENDYRKQLEDDQIVDYERRQLNGSVTGISPDRIKSYYDKNQSSFMVKEAVKVRQITLKPEVDETVELLMQTAAKYVQEARQPGASFEALAKQHSQDDYRDNGGLPPFLYYRDDKNSLVPKLAAVVFQLKPGEVSDPVENAGQVFIFKCEDKIAEGVSPLEKVRPQIEDILAQQDWRDAVSKWIEKLRAKAYIKNYLEDK